MVRRTNLSSFKDKPSDYNNDPNQISTSKFHERSGILSGRAVWSHICLDLVICKLIFFSIAFLGIYFPVDIFSARFQLLIFDGSNFFV